MNDLADTSISKPDDPALGENNFARNLSNGDKIRRAIDIFINNVNGIIFALNSLDETMRPRLKAASKSLTKFFQDHRDEVVKEKAGDTYKIEISRKLSAELMPLIKQRHAAETGNASLKKAILLALVSHWDSYISSL